RRALAGTTGRSDAADPAAPVATALRTYTLRAAAAAPPLFSASRSATAGTDVVREVAGEAAVAPGSTEHGGTTAPYASLRFVGQVFRGYLVCEGPDRLVLVDQHAAHERVAFERLRAQHRNGAVERQALLLPVT